MQALSSRAPSRRFDRSRGLLLLVGLLFPSAIQAEADLPLPGVAPAAPPAVVQAVTATPIEPLGGRPGPVPDYAPMRAMLTHAQLDDLSPELPRFLYQLLGERHVVEFYDPGTRDNPAQQWEEDAMLMWMRDYQPIYVRTRDGGLKAIRYLDPDPNRAGYIPGPSVRTGGERPGGELAVEKLPLIHENGNLVVSDRLVFVTDNLIADNRDGAYNDPHLAEAGYRDRDEAEILSLFARALERRVEDIVVLPPMPEEETGHIDLVLMALGPDLMMVPEIRVEAIQAAPNHEERLLARRVRDYLDRVANTVADHGLKVVRLPMLAPVYLPSVEDPEAVNAVFFSPANGLLVRTEVESVAILPVVAPTGLQTGQRRLNHRYQREWIEALGRHGWKTKLIDATDLGRYLGLFRCVSAPLPG